MKLTIKDKAEMKRMGYEYRAWFISPRGIPFHKDFTTYREMQEFIKAAKTVGTRLVETERR